MTKHIAIKDGIYNELDKLKPDPDRSFSFVLKQLMDENKALKEELEKKQQTIEKYKMDIV